jgi:hypothetical protein
VRVSRLFAAVIVPCCAVLALAAGSALAQGHLDPSFGEHGVVDLDAGEEDLYSGLAEMAVGPGAGGDIFFTEKAPDCSRGRCLDGVYLRRYRANGKLDRGFGNGRVLVGTVDQAELAVDSAGRPLVAFEHEEGVVVRRFSRDGRPDLSFGRSGSAFVPCGCHLGSLEVGPGRKPFVVGSVALKRASSSREVWFMARLRQNGSPDRSFGRGGSVRKPMSGFGMPEADIKPGGGATLSGFLCCHFPLVPFVQQMSPDGRLDKGYAAAAKRSLRGVPGTRKDDISWDGMALVRRPRGGVEVFADSYPEGAAVKLLPSGRRDASFGRNGVRGLSFGFLDATADGRGATLIVGVQRRRGRYTVARLLPSGRFDRRFGWVALFGAADEEGLEIVSHGRGSAIVFDRGLSFCRQGCDDDPKMFRVIASRR